METELKSLYTPVGGLAMSALVAWLDGTLEPVRARAFERLFELDPPAAEIALLIDRVAREPSSPPEGVAPCARRCFTDDVIGRALALKLPVLRRRAVLDHVLDCGECADSVRGFLGALLSAESAQDRHLSLGAPPELPPEIAELAQQIDLAWSQGKGRAARLRLTGTSAYLPQADDMDSAGPDPAVVGKLVLAVGLARRSLGAVPDLDHLTARIYLLGSEREGLEEAARLLDGCLASDGLSDRPGAWNDLAVAQQALGAPRIALDRLMRAIDEGGASPERLFNQVVILAECYLWRSCARALEDYRKLMGDRDSESEWRAEAEQSTQRRAPEELDLTPLMHERVLSVRACWLEARDAAGVREALEHAREALEGTPAIVRQEIGRRIEMGLALDDRQIAASIEIYASGYKAYRAKDFPGIRRALDDIKRVGNPYLTLELGHYAGLVAFQGGHHPALALQGFADTSSDARDAGLHYLAAILEDNLGSVMEFLGWVQSGRHYSAMARVALESMHMRGHLRRTDRNSSNAASSARDHAQVHAIASRFLHRNLQEDEPLYSVLTDLAAAVADQGWTEAALAIHDEIALGLDPANRPARRFSAECRAQWHWENGSIHGAQGTLRTLLVYDGLQPPRRPRFVETAQLGTLLLVSGSADRGLRLLERGANAMRRHWRIGSIGTLVSAVHGLARSKDWETARRVWAVLRPGIEELTHRIANEEPSILHRQELREFWSWGLLLAGRAGELELAFDLGEEMRLQHLPAITARESAERLGWGAAYLQITSIAGNTSCLLLRGQSGCTGESVPASPLLFGSSPHDSELPPALLEAILGIDRLVISCNGTPSPEFAERLPLLVVHAQACSRRKGGPAGGPAVSIVAIGDPGPLSSERELPALPAASQEVRLSASLASDAVCLVGKHATRSAVITELGRGRILHLAGHFSFAAARPLASAFPLAIDPGEPDAVAELSLDDLRSLDLGAVECVLLSCCCEDIGAERTFAAAQLLARTFMQTGAANVVVHAGALPDAIGKQFAAHFMRELILTQRPVADAFRSARAQLGQGTATRYHLFVRPPIEF